MVKKDFAIVYLVAGISSRFGGKIKQFAKVGPNGETLIEYSLTQSIPAGFSKIIFVVGNKTEQPFKEKFGNSYNTIPIYYALQSYDEKARDRPWGTADTLYSAKHLLDCPFVVCNGDDLYGAETFKILINHLKNNDSGASIGYRLSKVIPEKGTTNRGIFKKDSDNNVKEIKEIFDITKDNLWEKGLKEDDLCSMNIFALHPETVKLLEPVIESFKEKHKHDRRIECLIPEEISNLIKAGKLNMKLYDTPESWVGITNPEDEEIVRERLSETSN